MSGDDGRMDAKDPANFVEGSGNTTALIPTVGSADISATLDAIARRSGVRLVGDVIDMAGVLNVEAAYNVRLVEVAKGIEADSDWGYYAKQATTSTQETTRSARTFFEAWVRYNYEAGLYDYSIESPDLFDGHPTPSLGPVI